MKVTQINVGCKITHSLPEYSNIAPSFYFAVEYNENEGVNPYDIADIYYERAKELVQEKIDQELERRRESPFYDTKELYRLYLLPPSMGYYGDKRGIVVREGDPVPKNWQTFSRQPLKPMRWEAIEFHVAFSYFDFKVHWPSALDDEDRYPEVVRARLITPSRTLVKNPMCLLMPDNARLQDENWNPVSKRDEYVFVFDGEVDKIPLPEDYTLVNRLDGNLEDLPKLIWTKETWSHSELYEEDEIPF